MNLRGQNSVFQTLKEKRDLGETRKELATELVQSPLLQQSSGRRAGGTSIRTEIQQWGTSLKSISTLWQSTETNSAMY